VDGVHLLVVVAVCGSAVALAVVWAVAYRMGFEEGRQTIPLRLILALTEHRVACQHERPDVVLRDLIENLALPEREGRRLLARAQSTRRTRGSVPELRPAS